MVKVQVQNKIILERNEEEKEGPDDTMCGSLRSPDNVSSRNCSLSFFLFTEMTTKMATLYVNLRSLYFTKIDKYYIKMMTWHLLLLWHDQSWLINIIDGSTTLQMWQLMHPRVVKSNLLFANSWNSSTLNQLLKFYLVKTRLISSNSYK